MEKYITIKQSDFEAILGYIDTVLEFAYPENTENIAKVNDGYETFIKPFRETDKLLTPEAYAKNQEFETFCENLQDCYGVDVFAADKKVLRNLFDKFNEEFEGEASGIESDIITRLVNTTPLPALVESEAGAGLLLEAAEDFVNSLLVYSDKGTKVFGSAFEEDKTREEVAIMVLDFATQNLEEFVKRCEEVKPIFFDIEHKGYKLPENIALQEPDYPMSKKGNMSYWDAIETQGERFVEVLLRFAGGLEPQNGDFDEGDLDDVKNDILTDAGAEIVEFTVDVLIKKFDAAYPFVDEDY